MPNILMIIPPERFRDEELFHPLQEFLQAGHAVTIASTHRGICPGSRGGFAEAEISLAETEPFEFDAVVFVGGGGATLLFENREAHRIAQEMTAQNKIVAAICLAPVILARAGLVRGKNLTVSGQKAAELESFGARYCGPGVKVDGHLITANAPKASRLFGQTICEILANPQPE
jgi:protease I